MQSNLLFSDTTIFSKKTVLPEQFTLAPDCGCENTVCPCETKDLTGNIGSYFI